MITPEVKRLRIVYDEYLKSNAGENMHDFAKIFDLNQSSISRIMNGKWEMGFNVVKVVCYKLGYSPSWFINGTGNKKIAGDQTKLVTEIGMLRVELDIMQQEILKMKARMKSYEEKNN